MPTFEWWTSFRRDLRRLSLDQERAFRAVLPDFVADVQAGVFRPSLRVKGVQGTPGVFEMTWAADGRATWQYGTPVREGEPHIIWRRIGTHDILDRP